jgi:molybdopterin synthase sulfur carrier subunit
MKVTFYATLREIVGGRSVEFPAGPRLTAGELFEEVLRRYPGLRKELLDRNGELYGHVHFFVNGRDVRFSDGGWQTQLEDDDQVTIFPAVGGG